MISIENNILTGVDALLAENFPKAILLSDETRLPEKFPCVYLYEIDNYIDTAGSDSGDLENFAFNVLELVVYSNSTKGKKSECKKIFAEIDSYLLLKGFVRNSKTYISQKEGTLGRMVGRYTAIVSKDNVIYLR